MSKLCKCNKDLLVCLLFAALTCTFLWRAVFKGEALLPGNYLAEMFPWKSVVKSARVDTQWNPLQWDAIAQFYPWRVFYARSIRAGTIPLWNPHQFCGTPFLANAQSAVLYPPNLLFVLFDPIVAWTVYATLHLFLAGSFTYFLLRELGIGLAGGVLGGICYAFSAFNVRWLELPTFVGASVWLPLTFLLVHRSVQRRSFHYAVFAGLAQAMAFLAGHFQIAFYVAFAVCLWWLWESLEKGRASSFAVAFKNTLPLFLSFASITVLIASPQVLPTVELAQSSHRVREVTAEGYSRFVANSVASYRLITAFLPDFYGNPAYGNYFLGSAADFIEYGLYAGILPLVLAVSRLLSSKRISTLTFFALLGAVAMVSATGTPINYIFYFFVPGFSALGGPNRILVLYFFALAVLAGFGAEWMAVQETKLARWKGFEYRPTVVVAMVCALVLYATFAGCYIAALPLIESLPRPIRESVMDARIWVPPFAALSLVSLGLVFARGVGVLGRRVFELALIVVVIADLFAYGVNCNPTCHPSRVYPETQLIRHLRQLTADGSRIAPVNRRWSLYRTPNAILPPNAATFYGINDVQGYDSLYTRVYKDLSSNVQGEDSSPIENGNMVLVKRVSSRLRELAEYVLTIEPLRDPSVPVEQVGHWDGVYVYRLLAPHVRDYQPQSSFFSFRLGLFLGCLGVSVIACAACFGFTVTRFRPK